MHAESELVLRAAAGEAEAFGALAEDCRPWLRGLCFRLVRDPWAVEDLVQESLLLAFRDLAQLRDPDLFRPWLSRIARNVGRMYLRRRQARPEFLVALPPEREAPPSPDDGGLLGLLDQEAQHLLRLHHGEGWTVGEVATALALTPAAVRSRLHRARRQLRKEMLAMTAPRSAWQLHTVLLVEPDDDLRDSLRAALTKAGYEVVLLPTGEAAIQAVKQQRGQLLLLDKHCLEPHWLEVMGLVLTDAYGLKNVPICALVDPDNERDLLLAWHAGAQVCLTRPPNLPRLLGYLRHLAETWGREGEVTPPSVSEP